MLLRLIVYMGLAVDAAIRHDFILALICAAIPFLGPSGMWTATIAGVIFLILGLYIEAAVSVGLVVFNMVGNHLFKPNPKKS